MKIRYSGDWSWPWVRVFVCYKRVQGFQLVTSGFSVGPVVIIWREDAHE